MNALIDYAWPFNWGYKVMLSTCSYNISSTILYLLIFISQETRDISAKNTVHFAKLCIHDSSLLHLLKRLSTERREREKVGMLHNCRSVLEISEFDEVELLVVAAAWLIKTSPIAPPPMLLPLIHRLNLHLWGSASLGIWIPKSITSCKCKYRSSPRFYLCALCCPSQGKCAQGRLT